ncbi:transketolase [Nematocida minor]|uniref:transketolase n=1 Tax=Nematocida minor TaxID=1912983 RepID=UPI002220BA9D|nr:transketolase [Nematocida minor]KAI5190537.1 transketolase [Nematocida minor]
MHSAVEEIRVLIAEIVENAKSGHPGGPMGMANVMHILFSRVLSITKIDSKWINRDIFVLSNGHCCAGLYVFLHLKGFLSMEDLLHLRKIDSKTPGHPEFGRFIEATAGPLGQGVAQAVGYAIALKKNSDRYNKPALMNIFSNRVYCMVGDGCMQEGVAQEAFSVAGHLKLNNLIVIYDYNKITIDGPLSLSNSEDAGKKMRAMGFAIVEIKDPEDDEVVEEILSKKMDRPMFVIVHTTIGYDTTKKGTSAVHGSPLGKEEIELLKRKYSMDPAQSYYISEKTKEIYRECDYKINNKYYDWQKGLEKYKMFYPEEHAELTDLCTPSSIHEIVQGHMIKNMSVKNDTFSTRELSGQILSDLSKDERILGGSADLSESTCTKWEGAKVLSSSDYSGRYICYGIREHAMCGIMNGIAAYGYHRVYGSTFLNFLTYGFPAIRIAAISSYRVAILGTHDSIALGGDGPTHQPIETLALLRATPNLITFRPANRLETATAIAYSMYQSKGPCAIVLSRQKLDGFSVGTVDDVLKGAYIVCDYEIGGPVVKRGVKCPYVTLIATGSEVSLCLKVKELLCNVGCMVRLVSMVSFELFEAQDVEYKKEILDSRSIKVSIEALSTFGWSKYARYNIGIDTFGKSGPPDEVYAHFGFTPEEIAEKIYQIVADI